MIKVPMDVTDAIMRRFFQEVVESIGNKGSIVRFDDISDLTVNERQTTILPITTEISDPPTKAEIDELRDSINIIINTLRRANII